MCLALNLRCISELGLLIAASAVASSSAAAAAFLSGLLSDFDRALLPRLLLGFGHALLPRGFSLLGRVLRGHCAEFYVFRARTSLAYSGATSLAYSSAVCSRACIGSAGAMSLLDE